MMDRAAYLDALVSREWERDGFHCWAFVEAVQRDLFGVLLPSFGGAEGASLAGDKRARMDVFAGHPERARWQQTEFPEDGAIVMMTRRTSTHARDSHAGVFLTVGGRGDVWHCDAPHGVEAVAVAELIEMRRWHPTFHVRRS